MFSRIESQKNVTKVTSLFHESNTEIELRFCQYQASFTIQQMKKSNVYDDGLYLHQESKILPTLPLVGRNLSVCMDLRGFQVTGFVNQEFKLSTAELNRVIGDRTETTETFTSYLQSMI